MSNRPPKELYYLEVAKAVSLRSTCINKQWGAVIVNNDMIVSTGYNGSARGTENCSDLGYCYRVANNIPRGTCYETCLRGDTAIKLLDGTVRTIEDLEATEDEVWLYAFDLVHGTIVPARGINIRKTKHVTELARVWFKDGYIDCTPDHRFLLRNGKYRQAQYLHSDDYVLGINNSLVTMMRVMGYEPLELECDVYDMEVPKFENFAVELDNGSSIFVHNCRSVHAEANAIISAPRSLMLGATMYLYGYDVVNQHIVENGDCCMMCKRMVINSGIEEVVFADQNGIKKHEHPDQEYGYRITKVSNWINAPETHGY